MRLEEYFDFLAPNDIRLRGSRIGIESVLYEFVHNGRTPDEIIQRYPSLTLEQVYATITYYLHNEPQVRAYLENWLTTAAASRDEQQRNPSAAVARLRDLKRQQATKPAVTTEHGR
jgi:uncharacterized protein (DUF433 family)